MAKGRANDHSKYANWIDPLQVIPYELNAKIHTERQVRNICNSIRRFRWQQDAVITKDNVLVIGHGRRLAAIELGCEMPYHVIDKNADDLTEKDIRELRIADNQTNAETGLDFSILDEDIDDLDFSGFDFDFLSDLEENEEQAKEEQEVDLRGPSCQHNVFENQDRAQFPCVGFYGIPKMTATKTVGDKMLRFMDWKEIEDPENYIAHFYYDDYKFINAWRDPDIYIDRLRQFKAVVSPDFSLYTDFPRALQILSCYRRQWCGAYWQSLGIDVIPDVVWGDKESFAYCFDGIPKGGTVAVSSVGVKRDNEWNSNSGDLFKAGYDEMMKRIKPKTILFYGDMIDGLDGNIIQIPSYYAQKREILNEKAR